MGEKPSCLFLLCIQENILKSLVFHFRPYAEAVPVSHELGNADVVYHHLIKIAKETKRTDFLEVTL